MSPTLPDPGRVAAAFVDGLEQLVGCIPSGWLRRSSGLASFYTGVEIAALNGVAGLSATSVEIDAALDAVAGLGAPHCIQARPVTRAAAAEVAGRRGLVPEHSVPVMAAGGPLPGSATRDLAIRRCEPGEAVVHATLAAEAFEAPADLFGALVTEATLALDTVAVYLGELEGELVCTALTARDGRGGVGVFNVGTVPTHRGRGLGAAITAHAVNAAIDAGASWAWLQSSVLAVPVYQRLGFVTVEEWSCWVSD